MAMQLGQITRVYPASSSQAKAWVEVKCKTVKGKQDMALQDANYDPTLTAVKSWVLLVVVKNARSSRKE